MPTFATRPAVAAALRNERFDVVIDWIAFTPEHVATDIELFAGIVSQYVFISSATVYQQPSPFYPLVEDAPLGNPGWQYATDKIACEDLLRRETGFPSTIVRPAHTYGETRIPTAVDGEGYTIVDRMRRGKQVIVHDDGTSLWTLTHNTDFARALAGLLGNADAGRRELPPHVGLRADVGSGHGDDRRGRGPRAGHRAHSVRDNRRR